MKKIISIARLTFKEAGRDKFFSGVVFFFMFYLLFCVLLGKLSPGHTEQIMRSAGLTGVELSAVILIIFSVTLSFFRDKDTRIIEVYLSCFERRAYLGGKILGYFALSGLYLFFSGLGLGLILFVYKAFTAAVLAALYPLFLKLGIIVCVAALFSSLSSTPTTALLCSMFFCAAAELMPAALKIVRTQAVTWQRNIVETAAVFLPKMEQFDLKPLAAYGEFPSAAYFLWSSAYALTFIVLLWVINIYIFGKKEY
ncbi:MAG: hypothetical protein KJ893_05695 [Candidatus Omnitrophica bacterium]|nr:hypothetical protein [Candidatus Omnitrophota bacterium]MBU4479186.1 hypothetical protein [Candidatus Omnitrophota bacterium]